jgi:hypothetical protein
MSQSMRLVHALAVAAILLGGATETFSARDEAAAQPSSVAVGPEYSTTHVYVAPDDVDLFSHSIIMTFGGTRSRPAVLTITPTPSETIWRAVLTPVGMFSVLGFKTPIPHPFGAERTGHLVTDVDAAVRLAKTHNAEVVVAPFDDPVGRDVIIRWPGGVLMQLYRHTVPSTNPRLETVPENRVYVSPDSADAFVRNFVAFSGGAVVSDDRNAPGIEIGRPKDTYRRVRINSMFGKIAVLVTNGHLPYPYGRELTGYEVANLNETLTKAKAAGAKVLIEPYLADGRRVAIVAFPGGHIAEIHSSGG